VEHFIISLLCSLHLRREGSIGRGGAFNKILVFFYIHPFLFCLLLHFFVLFLFNFKKFFFTFTFYHIFFY